MSRAAEVDARLQLNRANALEARADELEARVGELERALEFMLRAPYEGLVQWSLTLACVRLDHPRVKNDPERACYCTFAGPGGWGE